MTPRDPSLDLIRTLTITFVVVRHFFLPTPFNQMSFGKPSKTPIFAA